MSKKQNHKFENYDEEFARQCIINLLPDIDYNLIINKNDPPDIISDNLDIGIEVTRLIRKEDAELKSIFENYSNISKAEIPRKLIDKIENRTNHQAIIFDKENKLAGFVSTVYNNHIQDKLLLDLILKKTKNLNSNNYIKCKQNYLFINNSGRFCFEYDLRNFITNNKERLEEYELTFLKYFIYCDHHFFICDIPNDTVESISIDDATIDYLKKETYYSLGLKNICNKAILGEG